MAGQGHSVEEAYGGVRSLKHGIDQGRFIISVVLVKAQSVLGSLLLTCDTSKADAWAGLLRAFPREGRCLIRSFPLRIGPPYRMIRCIPLVHL